MNPIVNPTIPPVNAPIFTVRGRVQVASMRERAFERGRRDEEPTFVKHGRFASGCSGMGHRWWRHLVLRVESCFEGARVEVEGRD